MKAKNLQGLELICKKCNNLRNVIPLETLPKEDQIEIENLQKELPELNLQFVICRKCSETSIVSQLIDYN